jgi:hypothetical protein
VSQFFPQSDSRGVQSPLDRSQRARESITHLDQRLAFEVEGDQCLSIEVSQSLQTTPQLIGSFTRHQFIDGRLRIRPDVADDFGILCGDWRPTNGSIDGQSDRDSTQPAREPFRFAQLAQLPHGLDENVLGQFGSFGLVSQPTQRDGENGRLKLLDKLPERHTASGLRFQNNWQEFLSFHDLLVSL